MIRPLFMTVSWPKLLRMYVNQVAGVCLLLFVLNKNYMSQGDRVAEVKPPHLLGKNFYVCGDIRFSLSNMLDTLKRTNLDVFPNGQS